jgi:hypothetical protein
MPSIIYSATKKERNLEMMEVGGSPETPYLKMLPILLDKRFRLELGRLSGAGCSVCIEAFVAGLGSGEGEGGSSLSSPSVMLPKMSLLTSGYHHGFVSITSSLSDVSK